MERSRTFKDRFERSLIADDILDVISGATRPITIGVSAPWGAGKTFLLNILREKLQSNQVRQIVPIFVDAWRSERLGDPLLGLLAALQESIEGLPTQQGLLERAVAQSRKLVARGAMLVARPMASAAGAVASALVGVDPSAYASATVAGSSKLLEGLADEATKSISEADSLHAEFRAELDTLLGIPPASE